jgi:hypothetical protein
VMSSGIANKRLTVIRPRASDTDPIDINASTANPDITYNEMHAQEFIQGSSTGAGLILLGHVNLCTSPAPQIHDRGFSTGLGPVFLGHIDLCTPSP